MLQVEHPQLVLRPPRVPFHAVRLIPRAGKSASASASAASLPAEAAAAPTTQWRLAPISARSSAVRASLRHWIKMSAAAADAALAAAAAEAAEAAAAAAAAAAKAATAAQASTSADATSAATDKAAHDSAAAAAPLPASAVVALSATIEAAPNPFEAFGSVRASLDFVSSSFRCFPNYLFVWCLLCLHFPLAFLLPVSLACIADKQTRILEYTPEEYNLYLNDPSWTPSVRSLAPCRIFDCGRYFSFLVALVFILCSISLVATAGCVTSKHRRHCG
jgi:hypothetical protein